MKFMVLINWLGLVCWLLPQIGLGWDNGCYRNRIKTVVYLGKIANEEGYGVIGKTIFSNAQTAS